MPIAALTPVAQLNAPSTCTTGTAAAAAAVVVTVAAPANTSLTANVAKQLVVTGITVSASGAASGAITCTVADGATNIFVTDLTVALGTAVVVPLPSDLAITLGNSVTVTLSAPAASSVLKVNVSTATA